MIKKILVSSCIVLTVSSFSFWKMRGILLENSNGIKTINSMNDFSIRNNPYLESTQFFLYDPHTKNCMGRVFEKMGFNVTSQPQEAIVQGISFLRSNFQYNDSFWKEENLIKINQIIPGIRFSSMCTGFFTPFQVVKKHLTMSDGKIKNILSQEEAKFKNYNTEFLKRGNVGIRKQFSSLSGVAIENVIPVDGQAYVKLSKNGKSIDLTLALRKYFNENTSNTELSDTINHADKDYKWSSFYKIFHKMNSPTLTFSHLDHLNSSEILAVWYLVPQTVALKDVYSGLDKIEGGKPITRTVERQIIGLAKDKEGKLFHWTTDLGKDISVLMQYANNSSDNNLNLETVEDEDLEEPKAKRLKKS